MSYEHQLLAQKTKTWKAEKILFYPKNGRRTAFSAPPQEIFVFNS
jgi:hypothetical protein